MASNSSYICNARLCENYLTASTENFKAYGELEILVDVQYAFVGFLIMNKSCL